MKENELTKYEFLAEDPNFKVMPIMLSLLLGLFLRF